VEESLLVVLPYPPSLAFTFPLERLWGFVEIEGDGIELREDWIIWRRAVWMCMTARRGI
jgi:hypothetical protein